ncbi:MAG: undecaprenyl-diphosphate phosphatase, partial [Bdellovibrionales bacterium]|nr:undecaprenyl-diphosphate phosphatase [Bdellovibrionales bacterium]
LLWGLIKRDSTSWQMALQIIVASIPTAIIGIIMKKKMEWLLTNSNVAALGLIVTGIILLISERGFQKKSSFNLDGFGINYRTAFLIGVAQGFAALPGISRSGSTIVTGLFLGMDTRNAARFSFLVSIPAIAGAGLLEFLGAEESLSMTELSLGAFVSFVTGLLAIRWMVQLVQNNKLKPFAYYVFALSGLFLAYKFFMYI